MLKVLLKGCLGPHWRCLGAGYGYRSQNSGWEPLL